MSCLDSSNEDGLITILEALRKRNPTKVFTISESKLSPLSVA